MSADGRVHCRASTCSHAQQAASQIFKGKHSTSLALVQVLSMARRTYQLQNTGLEVFFPGRSSLYLTLKTHAAREDLRSCLQAQPGLRMRQQRSLHMWRRDWSLGKVCLFCLDACRYPKQGHARAAPAAAVPQAVVALHRFLACYWNSACRSVPRICGCHP